MTNEELASKIQEGETSLLSDLWAQVEKFIDLKAYGYSTKYPELCASAGVTVEDLYQSGFFALCEAVKAFDPESGHSLLAYINYPFTNEFNRLTGRRTRRRDALNSARSLDKSAEFDFGNGNETSLLDLISDPSADEAFENVLEDGYREALRKALDKAIDSLTERQADVIRSQYFEGLSQGKIADRLKLSRSRIHMVEREALRNLRRSKHLQAYREEIIARFEYKSGYITWKRSGMSPQERILIKLEEEGAL